MPALSVVMSFSPAGSWWARGGPFDDETPVAVPAGGHRREERVVSVGGVGLRVVVLSRGDYAALQFRVGTVGVTAVARLGFPGDASGVAGSLVGQCAPG